MSLNLTIEEATKVLKKYDIHVSNEFLNNILKKEEKEKKIEGAAFSGGTQIDVSGCTTNNVCTGC